MLKIYETDALKTSSKRLIQKTAETTGDFIGNKIADRVRKVSKNSKQNHSEKVTIEYDKETPKERYISLEKDKKLLMNWGLNCIIIVYEKHQKQLAISLVTKLQKFQKNQNKVVQRQLQTRMIKQYLKKNIYFQKKGTKLLIIWQLIQYYNSIIMKYQKKKKKNHVIYQINHLNLESKVGLKWLMMHEEGIILITKLDLELRWQGQLYVIIVMLTYLL